ncbi:GMP synthase [Piedraia hortae CBS 480.64]|uniref:GMP synthase [glutamine-hydrolyzing] n=1 Tax=Piedraia hortae CBS 480.64 TaxID=1314780 RepID=A0A6A7C2T1_9PEZI|nr:GMP synthase [Piedraia hortae CBS 480.64]
MQVASRRLYFIPTTVRRLLSAEYPTKRFHQPSHSEPNPTQNHGTPPAGSPHPTKKNNKKKTKSQPQITMSAAPPHTLFDTLLVLDFGSQYTHLITRRLRELGVYSELYPCTVDPTTLPFTPKGIILSGGPYSVYSPSAPHISPKTFTFGIPILGICYGLQEIAWHHGQGVVAGAKKEYGHAELEVTTAGGLFEGLGEKVDVWMSHGDKLSALPEGFEVIATTSSSPYAAIGRPDKGVWGIQFHPEVTHTACGVGLLRNFAVNICQAKQNWTMKRFVATEIARIRETVGEKGQVIGAVSGGVDSSVAARLMHEAIGKRFHAVLVDNGLLRKDEARSVKRTLREGLGIDLTVVDARERFLGRLKGVTDPERKRKIIGGLFIEVFDETAKEIAERAGGKGKIEFLLQGTLYPDVIESISFKGPSETIKTHHNVGGLPEKMDLKLIEPLRELFKDEVREMGTELGLPREMVWRHPFPGPGLGIRIIGEVTEEKVRTLQDADAIFIEELRAAGLYDSISQAVLALMDGKAVGVVGDKRFHGYIAAIRAVKTDDFMTATAVEMDYKLLKKIIRRICNEVEGVVRVLVDLTDKPPATIEFE